MRIATSTLTAAGILVSASLVHAQTITWQSPLHFDNGVRPTVAMVYSWPGVMLQEHQATEPSPLNATDFWESAGSWSSGFAGTVQFDQGYAPAIAGDATNNQTLVTEVHMDGKGNDFGPSMWYRTGTLSLLSPSVSWLYSAPYANGYFPTIAQSHRSSGAVFLLEAHNGFTTVGIPSNATNQLYYLTGSVNGDGHTVTWTNHGQYDSGFYSAIALMPRDDDSIFVVEVHQAYAGPGAVPLWVHTGYVPSGSSTITWTAGFNYDSGFSPSIAVCAEPGSPNGPSFVEVHNDGSTGNLWFRTGRVNANNTITFNGGGQFDVGLTTSLYGTPRVACAGYNGVVLHSNSSAEIISSRFSIN